MLPLVAILLAGVTMGAAQPRLWWVGRAYVLGMFTVLLGFVIW